jgi:hypothetical protein
MPAIVKHVFYCHSAITALVATSVISKLGVSPEDVHVIWGRGYKWAALPYPSTALPADLAELAEVPSYGCRHLTRKHRKSLKALDRFLSQCAKGARFIAYLPNTRNFLMQAVATNANVAGLDFLEEGLMSYAGAYEKPTSPSYSGLLGTARRWSKRTWHGGRSYFYRPMRFPKEPVLFTINPRLEQQSSTREAVFAPVVSAFGGGQWRHDARQVFVFDVIVEFGYCEEAALLGVFRHFLRNLYDGKDTLVIRFHPAQKMQDRILREMDECGVRYAVDESSTPLELVMAQRPDLTLYGFHSSLLFYAKVFGLKAYSLAKLLAAADARARKWYADTMPAVFYEALSFYEN